MPCVIRRIALEGSPRLEPVPFEADSLADSVRFELPGGVYAAFGTWNDRRVIRLGAHFDRLEDSARRLGFELELDRELVRSELCTMMQESGFHGAKFRLSVTPDREGGVHAATAGMEPFEGPPVALREQGVICRTAPHAARSNPRAKQTSWLAERTHLGDGEPYEWLLLDDDGRVLEGASSNFYTVTSDGVLRTAGDGVLQGIARSIVLDVAGGVLPVRLEAPSLDEAYGAAEAFVTSASRGIVPVVTIDNRTIGSGRPGPMAATLTARYDERAGRLEEAICR